MSIGEPSGESSGDAPADAAVSPPSGAESAENTPRMPLTGEFLDHMSESKVTQEDGWITISPARPVEVRSQRISRPLLGEYLRLIHRREALTLEQKAYYAFRCHLSTRLSEDAMVPQLVEMLDMLLSLQPSGLDGGDDSWLQFYGSLSEGQQRQAANGGLSLGSLSDASRKLLKDIYCLEPNFEQAHEHDFNAILAGKDENSIPLRGITGEPSEAVYDGITSQGVLHIVEFYSYAVLDSTDPMRVLDERNVAEMRFQGDNPDEGKKAVEKKTFIPSRIRHLRLFIRYNDLTEQTANLDDPRPGEGQPVPYADLPEDFRKRVEEAAANMRRGDEAGAIK